MVLIEIMKKNYKLINMCKIGISNEQSEENQSQLLNERNKFN